MKKLFSFFFILIIIFTVFFTGIFIIVKNEARSEKIIERLETFANKNNIYLVLNDLKYSISLSGIKIILYDVSMKSNYMNFVSQKIKLQIDFLKIIRKKLEFKNIEIINAKVNILNINSENSNRDVKNTNDYLSLSSWLTLKNTDIIYDTFNMKQINGDFYIKDLNSISIVGDFSFLTNNFDLNKYGKIECLFDMDFDKSINIKSMVLKNKFSQIECKGKKHNSIIKYKLNAKIHDISVLRNYYDIDSLSLAGKCDIKMNGEYILDSIWKNNILYMDSLEIIPINVNVLYKNYNLYFNRSIIFRKENNDFIIKGNFVLDTFKIKTKTIIDMKELLKNNIHLYTQNDSLNIAVYSLFYNNDKININGFINSASNIFIPFDSINIYNIKKRTQSLIFFDSLQFQYDTFKIAFKECKVKLENGFAFGNVKGILGKYISVNDTFSLNIMNFEMVNKIYSYSNIENYFSNMKGKAYSHGKIIYNFEKRKLSGIISAYIPAMFYTSLNDTFSVKLRKIDINDLYDYDIENISIKGKFLYGYLKNINYTKVGELHTISGNIDLQYINLDSLFPKDTQKIKKQRNIQINIPKVIYANLTGICDSVIIQNEIINDINFKFAIKNSYITVDSVNGKMLKGDIFGNIKFNSNNNKLDLYAKTENVTINQLIKRHKLIPYNLNANINSNTKLTMNINDIKHTIKGKINVEAKDGWLEAPKLFKVLSVAFKNTHIDTFYFDNMYGVFDVGDSCAEFKDFYMGKNGHSLIYSGWIDFNRLMTIDGNYTIDMNIADTKALETLLRKVNYNSDSIIVKFKIIGNYNDPDIEITYNSLTRFLKNKTKVFIKDFFNDFKDAFK